jgi:uncharacterized protein YsxB (DUF464 family)
MITAKFYRKPSNGSIHMTLKGHANAAPKGEDLICASATMLAYTVAQAVQFMHEQGQLKKKPKIHIKDGEATVIATPTEDAYAEALHTFWVAQCGIHVLTHNYPGHVRLEHLTV